MGSETMKNIADYWTVGWTLLLAVGYCSRYTPWPGLRALRSPTASRWLLATTAGVVLLATLFDARAASTTMATWAILFASLNWLFHFLDLAE